jgi:hypothetical protein
MLPPSSEDGSVGEELADDEASMGRDEEKGDVRGDIGDSDSPVLTSG